MARTDHIQFSREEIGRFVLLIYLLSKEQEMERSVLLSRVSWLRKTREGRALSLNLFPIGSNYPRPCPACSSSPFFLNHAFLPPFFSFLPLLFLPHLNLLQQTSSLSQLPSSIQVRNTKSRCVIRTGTRDQSGQAAEKGLSLSICHSEVPFQTHQQFRACCFLELGLAATPQPHNSFS